MDDQEKQSPSEFFDWKTIRETPEYINSVRKILSKRTSNHKISSEVFTQVFSLTDIKKFIQDNKLAINYDEVIYAADEDYKEYEKTGDLGSNATPN